MNGPISRLAAASMLTAGLLIATMSPALAHAELLGSVPAPNARLTQPPSQIRLVFSEELQVVGNSIGLVNARDEKVEIGAAAIDPADDARRTLVADLPDLPAGAYTAQWKNLSVDGHSVRGSFGFTVAPQSSPGTEAACANTGQPVRVTDAVCGLLIPLLPMKFP